MDICKEDKKRDYLIKTLSRTKRKDYENYIINGIWHKLNNLDLKPVTQQYIKTLDGEYYSIDLYFPQINYGIECDEAYHINNAENDIIRELKIEEALESVNETKGFILRRVKAYESIDYIEIQIEEIVQEIKSIIKNKDIEKWGFEKDASKVAIEKGIITLNDNLRFEKIVDVLKLFGKDYKGVQQCYFKNIVEGYTIWCPKIAEIIGGKKVAGSRAGWINYLSEDWKVIYEKNKDVNERTTELFNKEDEYLNLPRITFAQSKDSLGNRNYRFIGVYKYNKEKSQDYTKVYELISDEFNFNNK